MRVAVDRHDGIGGVVGKRSLATVIDPRVPAQVGVLQNRPRFA